VKSADVCTDPKCFDDKRQAHYRTALAALEGEGFKVIAGDAAKKALPGWEHRRQGSYLQFSGGFERFDGSTYVNGRSQKVSALFDRDFKPTKLQHPLTGEIFDVVTQQAITAAAAKHKKTSGGKASKKRASGPRERALKPDEIFRRRLFTTVLKKMPATPGRAELRIAAEELLEACEESELVADVFAPRKDGKPHDFNSSMKALEALAEKMTPADLCRLAAASAASRDIAYSYGQPKRLLELAKACRVEPAAVKKAIADEAKVEKTKASANAKGQKAAKAAKVKKPPARRKPNSHFMKPMQPSAALAVVVGDKPMPRTEVTSKLWAYIKKKNLQDKVNRRMINVDEALRPVLGNKKQVSMFEMTKLIAKHLK
jgi:upstream activation factor subunit UAF30